MTNENAKNGSASATKDGPLPVDWMTKLLQSDTLTKIPPTNIHRFFMALDEMEVNKGQKIIQQGEIGDTYYVIKEGKCSVIRKTRSGNAKLAELGPGDAFGEDALLAEVKRNATVVMDTNGVVMSLAKQDFQELLQEPLLDEVNVDQVKDMLKKGGVVLLDVRNPAEFKKGSLKGAVNLPVALIRSKAKALNKNKKYVCICDSGSRSAAAAFILGELGLNAQILGGGLSSL